jgi:hypothetical protein
VNNRAIIYTVSRGYRKLTAWVGDPKTRRRWSVETVTPHKHFNRRERYEVLARTLGVCYGLTMEPYSQTDSRRPQPKDSQ